MFRLYLSVVLVAVKDAGEWVEQSKKKHRNVTRWIWAEFKEAKWSDSGNGGRREGSAGWSMETWMLCVCWAQSHKSVVCWGPRGDGMAAYCCGRQISGMSHEDFSIWHSTEQKREPGLCCLNRGRSVSPGVSRPVCVLGQVWMKCVLCTRSIGLWLLRSWAELDHRVTATAWVSLPFPFLCRNFKNK